MNVGNNYILSLHTIQALLLLTVLFVSSGVGEAASVITIAPSGTAAYSITASDLPESAGIDLTVRYDAAALGTPRVKSGPLAAGAMMEANGSAPGIIRIIFITAGTIKGTGELASVTFTPQGTVPASPPKLTSSLYSVSGTQLPVQTASGSPQPDPVAEIAAGGSKNSGSGIASGGSGVVPTTSTGQTSAQITVGGSVTLPQEPVRETARRDEIKDEPSAAPEPSDTGAVSVSGAPALREQQSAPSAVPETGSTSSLSALKSIQSVPERFRTFKGTRTVKSLAPLLDNASLHAAGIIQKPSISVSDGRSTVTVTVDLAGDADTPSFTLKGANLKSIRKVAERKWELDALPQKGKSDVRLSIILSSSQVEIPLVVVPPLTPAGAKLVSLPTAAFDALLAKPLNKSAPAYDLNSDGRQDYLDDYILLVHRLLLQARSADGAPLKPSSTGK
jgi:hypothetical protein